MALKALRILKELAPLIVQAGSVAAGLRSSGSTRIDDRVTQLEDETLRAGEVLNGVAKQLHAIAQELRTQAESLEALRKKTHTLLIVSLAALCTGTGAFIAAFARG